jgi:hypothetical protein
MEIIMNPRGPFSTLIGLSLAAAALIAVCIQGGWTISIPMIVAVIVAWNYCTKRHA